MEYERACYFTRYNSGKMRTDSGEAFGRHYDRPADPEHQEILLHGNNDPKWMPECSINLTRLIADTFEEDVFLTLLLEVAGEADPASTWYALAEHILEALGYRREHGGNTCNAENDLSQDFAFHIFVHESYRCADWVYGTSDDYEFDTRRFKDMPGYFGRAWARMLEEHDWHHSIRRCQEDTIDEDGDRDVVEYLAVSLPAMLPMVMVHTGCDVRYGYAQPMLGTFSISDYVMPLDWCIEWYAEPVSGTDSTSYDAEAELSELINEECSSGYSSNPTYHLQHDVGVEFLEFDRENGRFKCTRNGVEVWVSPHRPYY